jgi:hypothetical protein
MGLVEMITCQRIDNDHITGRLGNKLFVIATSIALAKSNNDECIMPSWKFQNIFPNVKIGNPTVSNIYNEKQFHYVPIEYQKDMSIQGYFQSYKYFENYKNDIVDFYFKMNVDKKLDTLWDYDNLVSIHIRRTDYIHSQSFHPIVPINYYRDAAHMFKGYSFLVFSDDIQWCKNTFRGNAFHFVEGYNDYEDLYMMSKCKNNIIANSSFSWWAAYMNKNIDNKVIVPKYWFGPSYAHYNIDDLRPKEWIQL